MAYTFFVRFATIAYFSTQKIPGGDFLKEVAKKATTVMNPLNRRNLMNVKSLIDNVVFDVEMHMLARKYDRKRAKARKTLNTLIAEQKDIWKK